MLPNRFYIISFSVSFFASFINILFGFIIITTVVINRKCRTVANMMMCNTAAATTIYASNQILIATYGIREDWFQNQPACGFRSYLHSGFCVTVCVSYAAQSISRLFFSIFHKHKYLRTWRIHWFLIIINYLIGILGPIPTIFIKNANVLELESRICVCTTKVFPSSMYIITIAFIVPFSIIIIIYSIIFYHARQSTRRVEASASDGRKNTIIHNSFKPNLKREMKLMKNIWIVVNIFACGGSLYLILVVWHATRKQPPPEPLYLLAIVSMTVFAAAKMIALFLLNKEVKNVAVGYLRKLGRF